MKGEKDEKDPRKTLQIKLFFSLKKASNLARKNTFFDKDLTKFQRLDVKSVFQKVFTTVKTKGSAFLFYLPSLPPQQTYSIEQNTNQMNQMNNSSQVSPFKNLFDISADNFFELNLN